MKAIHLLSFSSSSSSLPDKNFEHVFLQSVWLIFLAWIAQGRIVASRMLGHYTEFTNSEHNA